MVCAYRHGSQSCADDRGHGALISGVGGKGEQGEQGEERGEQQREDTDFIR
jgi:hypothetical protein